MFCFFKSYDQSFIIPKHIKRYKSALLRNFMIHLCKNLSSKCTGWYSSCLLPMTMLDVLWHTKFVGGSCCECKYSFYEATILLLPQLRVSVLISFSCLSASGKTKKNLCVLHTNFADAWLTHNHTWARKGISRGWFLSWWWRIFWYATSGRK